MEREAALWFGGAGGAGVGVNRDTPSAAASLRPGPGFRVVTEQPIRGVGRAPGLSSANTAGTHPKNGGRHKGEPPFRVGAAWRGFGVCQWDNPVIPGHGERVWRCFGEH